MADQDISDTIQKRYYRLGRTWGENILDPATNTLFSADRERHDTVGSLQFARILLDARESVDVERAGAIIATAIEVQVTVEHAPDFGGFPRFIEDDTADADAAPFAAQTMLELLSWHGSRLGDAATSLLESALANYLKHDMARWVSPAYTSVALLSSFGLGCGGDWLRDKEASDAGRDKLAEVHACVKATGAFDEYPSPVRSATMLRALASWLAFAKDDESIAIVQELWDLAWTKILAPVHLPTGQLAGPHSNTSGRDMLRDTRGPVKFYLHRAIGDRFPLGNGEGTLFPALMVQDADCPISVRVKWEGLEGVKTEFSVVDSCSNSVGLPQCRISPSYRLAVGAREKWEALVESKGRPGDRAFRGQVQETTTYLGRSFCLGTVNASASDEDVSPLIAHWPGLDGEDRVDYVVALALKEERGVLRNLPGGVMCLAQNEGRVLGLLRFGFDEDGNLPKAEAACLAFQMNADATPEVIAHGNPKPGGLGLPGGVILRAHGFLCGIRTLQVRISGASIGEEISELSAPGAPVEGEIGVHLKFGPVAPEDGASAYVAFALEVCEENTGGGVPGLAQRLNSARVAGELNRDGWVRLAWGSALSLETSTRVLHYRSWMTPEGAVRIRG